jgi:di/tricarboxylate transporter
VVALAVGQDPRLLMILATIISSYDFMLPVCLSICCASPELFLNLIYLKVGTPPNTIVYATGKIKITQMMTAGSLICGK